MTQHDRVSECEVTFTRWSAPYAVTKELWLDEHGALQSTSTAQNLHSGDLEVITCSPERFAKSYLPKLTSQQCTSYGVPHNCAARKLVTKRRLTEALVERDFIARDNDHLMWPDQPAIMMIDYDPDGDGDLNREELLRGFYALIPDLQRCAHVHWYSSSSFISHEDTSRPVTEARGQRLYLFVKSGSDVERAASALFKRAWLSGWGRIKISKSGHLLTRCRLFDRSVYQPSRIDFNGPPVCRAPLVSQRPVPMLLGDPTMLLDTALAIPELTVEETEAFKAKVADARRQKEAEAVTVRQTWVQARVQEAVSRGITQDVAMHTYERAINEGVLTPDFELITAEGESVTVRELLANPATFDQMRFHDPLEPDYRGDPRIAVAFTLGPSPILYSHAHGGRKYHLQGKLLAVTPSAGQREAALTKIAKHLGDRLLAFADVDTAYFLNKNHKLEPLDHLKAMRLIDSHIELQKVTSGGAVLRTDCTEQLGRLFIGAHAADLPHIVGSVRQPIMDPLSGEILSQTKYYPTQRCLVIEATPFHAVPDHPDLPQIAAALQTLWYPMHKFAFVDSTDVAVALAAMLTALVRPLLPTAPAFAIDAPVQGSGKTLAARTIGHLGGDEPILLPPLEQAREDEVRKRLLSTLMEKPACAVLDNIVGEFDSPSLAALLTSSTFSDRVLGGNKIACLNSRTLFLLTGNNLCFRGDMARRVYVARVDPRVESPHQRHFDFDPYEYVVENHQAIVAAGLTLLRANYLRQSTQRIGKGRTASFELWDDCIRQTVCWIAELQKSGKLATTDCVPQLCDPNNALNDAIQSDPELAKLQRVLVSWVILHGFKTQLTVSELTHPPTATWTPDQAGGTFLKEASRYELNGKELKEALADAAGDAKLSIPNPRSLGRWLTKHKDRIVHGVALRAGSKRGGSIQWYIEDCAGQGLANFEGVESGSAGDGQEAKPESLEAVRCVATCEELAS